MISTTPPRDLETTSPRSIVIGDVKLNANNIRTGGGQFEAMAREASNYGWSPFFLYISMRGATAMRKQAMAEHALHLTRGVHPAIPYFVAVFQ